MLILLISAALVYYLVSGDKRATVPGAATIDKTIVTPEVFAKAANEKAFATLQEKHIPVLKVIRFIPLPGYSGPVNGPFKWAGVGDPPDGVWITNGKAVYDELTYFE